MLAEKIEKYCEKKGISIRQFEIMCGLSNGLIGKWKNGLSPTVTSLSKIADATKTDLKKWV